MDQDYSAKNIQVLKGLEAVRKRPGMYIGSTSLSGLHHLVYEVIDNSVDEALEGHCSKINIEILEKNMITVKDNGRGIPVDLHPEEQISALEIVMTKLHAGGKFNNNTYKVSGGLHGVGVSVVNALSAWCKVEVFKKEDGKIVVYSQEYKCGIRQNEVHISETFDLDSNIELGTKTTFLADEEIFESIEYNFDSLSTRLRELAFLNKGLIINIKDKRNDKENNFYFKGGIIEFIKHINKAKITLIDPLYFFNEEHNTVIEVAFQYNDRYEENVYSFVNNINTKEGGTHLVGFKNALNKAISEYFKRIKKPEVENINSDDIKEGLTAILSIKMQNPQFEGQTKTKLGSNHIKALIESSLLDSFKVYFEENPQVINMILQKVTLSAKARIAAKKARELTRKKNTLDNMNILPGKLADCTQKDPALCEVFIVEGDSAGGSAKQGRDRNVQAILPLWGKMLNVEKSREEKVIGNTKLLPIIATLGTNIGSNFNIEKLRYHKIIIMADADVDGSHIRTLLLTFFYRYMKPLIENGFVYIAMPPLYKVTIGSKEQYAYDEKEKDKILKALDSDKKTKLQRYKGLGEMSAKQLWDTTMNPLSRSLMKMNLEDALEAEIMFTTLMGEEVQPRKEFIEKNALNVTNLDI